MWFRGGHIADAIGVLYEDVAAFAEGGGGEGA